VFTVGRVNLLGAVPILIGVSTAQTKSSTETKDQARVTGQIGGAETMGVEGGGMGLEVRSGRSGGVSKVVKGASTHTLLDLHGSRGIVLRGELRQDGAEEGGEGGVGTREVREGEE
jgi:hypothetical protein